MNAVIGVPYHLDEYLPDLDVPLRAGHTVSVEFTSGDVWNRLAVLYGAVADAVAGAASRGERPVVVSGDCTTALGTVAGLQRAGTAAGIVWFDAHGDVQTLETTASGYIGGCSSVTGPSSSPRASPCSRCRSSRFCSSAPVT